MLPGIFGYSILLELLVFYYALTLAWQNIPRRWILLVVGIVALIVLTNPSSDGWGSVYGGHYDFLWDEILRNFGFH